jgi:hypothetical protein
MARQFNNSLIRALICGIKFPSVNQPWRLLHFLDLLTAPASARSLFLPKVSWIAAFDRRVCQDAVSGSSVKAIGGRTA